MDFRYKWLPLFEAAVTEFDPEKHRELLDAAMAVLNARLKALPRNELTELHAIENAAVTIADLRRYALLNQ